MLGRYFAFKARLVASYRAVTLYWSPDDPNRLDVLARTLGELRVRIAALMGETVGKAEDEQAAKDLAAAEQQKAKELFDALKRDVEQNKKR